MIGSNESFDWLKGKQIACASRKMEKRLQIIHNERIVNWNERIFGSFDLQFGDDCGGRNMSATVLVAEDEFLIAMDVMDELGAAGFVAVGPFANTAQALAYCREHRPDCAVLDVRLADGDSFALADFLAQCDVPVVFHSGHAAKAALAQRYPQMHVCPKPSSRLAATVAEALRPHGSA